MSQVLIIFIRAYQIFVSPFWTAAFGTTSGCRYEISCSEYAIGALKSSGVFHGGILSLRRILSCRP